MKALLFIVGFILFINCYHLAENNGRNRRFLAELLGGFSSPRCRGCPPRNCLRDIAVIKGYCCGCSRVSDYLPIDCPTFPNCPTDGRSLCRDYDYMLDCCCP